MREVVRALRALAAAHHHQGGQGGHGGGGGQGGDRQQRPRRYLVVINPYSGTGQSEAIYREHVGPMLGQAGIEPEVCVTERGGHAMERMRFIGAKDDDDANNSKRGGSNSNSNSNSNNNNNNNSNNGGDDDDDDDDDDDISTYDGLIAMGGDGILWEMLQGIRSRPDAARLLRTVPLGIVGCGTSNGLAKSLLHAAGERYGPLESTFAICKGRAAPVDLARYEVARSLYAGFLTFSWAFIADVDLDSECIRWMGVLRNDVWAAYRILVNRSYRARFSYLPPPPQSDHGGVAASLPPLDEPVPEGWTTIEGDFVLFWASQVTHAAHNTFQSPLSQLQDGLFRIMVVRAPISRLRMVQIALAMETGRHVHHDRCEMYECVAFRLEPLEDGSHNDLDGEKIEDGPIQAAVQPAAARFFSGVLG